MSAGAMSWWGTYPVPPGESRRWLLGPTSFVFQRLAGEWRVARSSSGDPLADTLAIAEPCEDGPPRADTTRFGVSGDDTALHLTPRVADRPVVARPVDPFAIPAGEEATLFVSSPLWLHAAVGSDRTEILDVPILRPSDTWFGPSPREGELCYATQASFRLRLAEVPARPHRAVTRVHVVNRGREVLDVERVNLSVPHLSIYAAQDGSLWTSDVRLEHTGIGDRIAMDVRRRAPAAIPRAREIAAPRARGDNLVVRAFTSLFSTHS